MELIHDILENRKQIEKSINQHGFFAEHNFMHYSYQEDEDSKSVFVSFDDNKGLMCLKDRYDNTWELFSEALAPKEEQVKLIDNFLSYAFKKDNAKKVSIEVTSPTRKQILKQLKNKYHICNLNYSLVWPIFDMNEWKPELPGKRFKKLRNIVNRFNKYHKVEVKDSKDIPKEQLKQIITDWTKTRLASDRVHKEPFYNLINNGFKGCDYARTLIVNNQPCTITAGWKIPNSNNYYSELEY